MTETLNDLDRMTVDKITRTREHAESRLLIARQKLAQSMTDGQYLIDIDQVVEVLRLEQHVNLATTAVRAVGLARAEGRDLIVTLEGLLVDTRRILWQHRRGSRSTGVMANAFEDVREDATKYWVDSVQRLVDHLRNQ